MISQNRHILFTLFFLINVFTSENLYTQLHCINYTSQDGLNADHIICATEDSNGLMWFGTSNGLNRFDGHQFVDFSFIGNGPVPGGVMVQSILCDSDDNIWIGTEQQGIFKYNNNEDQWTAYSQDMDSNHKLAGNSIYFLHYTSDNKIWYGGENTGLGCIDINRDTVINYSILHLPRRNSWPNAIYDLVEPLDDSSKFFMVGHGYILVFNRNTESFEILEDDSNSTLESTQWKVAPHSLSLVPNGNVWIGTWNSGIYEYDIHEKSLVSNNPKEFDKDVIWRSNVFELSEDKIWTAYRQDGIAIYDFKQKKWTSHIPEPYNRNSLLGGQYESIFISLDKNVWIMSTNGLSLIVPEYQSFSYYEEDIKETNFFLDSYFHEKSDQYFFCYAGEDGPLKVYDQKMNLKSKLEYDLPGHDFKAIYKIIPYEEKLLFQSDIIYSYNFLKEDIEPLEMKGMTQKGNIVDMVVDENGDFWILYSNHTLVYYDPKLKMSKAYKFESHKLHGRPFIIYHNITSIDNYVWIAAGSEMIVFNKSNSQASFFRFNGEDFFKANNPDAAITRLGSISQILQINENCSWILMNKDGLAKVCYDQATDSLLTIKRVGKETLTQLQVPVEIIKGDADDYWIATRNGLIHADREISEFRLFNRKEGLKNAMLSQGLSKIDDKLFIGMPKGFVSVDTKKLLRKKEEKECVITESSLSGINLLCDNVLNLSRKDNDFLVSVSFPVYHDASSVTYAHRLLNFNDEWVTSGSASGSFRYEQLPPGDYRFEVKAKSFSVPWSEIESLDFTVLSPFWQKWWFRMISILSVLAILYLIYRIRVKLHVKEEQNKTKIAELEGQALRTQMNPHFIFNSLNSIKSLILMNRRADSIRYLTQFSRLVREILSNSKEQFISLEKELDLLSLYLEMESLRFQNKFTYKIDIDPAVNIYKSKVPPLIIQPYVENSLWHGLLHKEENGELNISIRTHGELLEIEVLDNGIGRATSANLQVNKLGFIKKYFGSKISRERIELLSERAEVKVNDLYDGEVPAGTQVIIKIPQDYERND